MFISSILVFWEGLEVPPKGVCGALRNLGSSWASLGILGVLGVLGWSWIHLSYYTTILFPSQVREWRGQVCQQLSKSGN